MRIGRYRPLEPLGMSPLGPSFSAVDDDGAEWELRLPTQPAAEAERTTLHRRLRLLMHIEHPALLPIRELDLSSDPSYFVLPRSTPAAFPLPVEQVWPTAKSVVGLLAAAHRAGLTLGIPSLRQTAAAPLLLDLSNGGALNSTETAGDVERLSAILRQFGPVPPEATKWDAILSRMSSRNDPPTAVEVLGWFDEQSLGDTRDSPPVDATQVVAVQMAIPQIGETIGRFRILEKLGEGGMGIVFKAEDSADGSLVALKLLRQSPRGNDVLGRRRFVREGRLLGALDSPYVTRLIDAGIDGERAFIALEFVEGASLGNRVRKEGRLVEPEALDLIADAARGLAAAHSAGIIHRDVKPDNMLLTANRLSPGPRLKVTDFGLARSAMPTESMELTRSGTTVGTPLYMASEQFGSEPVDARADVYALAATLFFMLTGKPPFQADGIAALAKRVSQEEAPSLDRASSGVSSATASLLKRCLSKEPSRRPIDAAAMLRELERLRSGQPLELGSHPRSPEGGKVREYVHSWDLTSTAEQLWPYVSNTERLNRAVGLPNVNYAVLRDPKLGIERLASARVSGMRMEWKEHPFEWIEGRRLGILREFTKGPFVWFLSIVDLEPLPNSGCRVKQTLRAEPRGWLGQIAARIELGIKASKNLGRVYRKMDQAIQSRPDPAIDAFEAPTSLSRGREMRLRGGVNKLIAAGVAPEAAEILGLYLSNAPEPEVARIRPLAVGRRFGISDNAIVDACLRAVPAGLLQLQWDIICPLCRIPSGRKDTLRELKEHENCPTCDKDFQSDFAQSVEMVFKAHPDIRSANAGQYCAGGPAHSPHVVAQTRVAAHERIELELLLSAGSYQVRGPQLPWSLELRVDVNASNRRCELDLANGPPNRSISLAAGGQLLAIRNTLKHEVVVRIERTAARDDLLTAAMVITIPAFRELFPDELLSPGQLAPSASVTLVWVKIAEGETLMDRLGEAQAFRKIQAAFQAIGARVRSENGVLVKAVGESLLLAFGEITSAVRASIGLCEAIRNDPICSDLHLRIGLHRGLALVASVNDRLDYFGHAVQTAMRLSEAAGPDQLLLTPQLAGDPEISALLRRFPLRLDQLEMAGRTLVYRVELINSA